MATAQFNMFNTDELLDIDRLQVHCLQYYTWVVLQGTEKMEYCFDSSTERRSVIDDFVNTRDRNFTFEELHKLHLTADQLLSWSATIDLAERYQYYIDHPNDSFLARELFFNCSRPWFGPHCEYSFGLGTTYSFDNVLRKKWQITINQNVPDGVTYVTCYVHLKCDRGGPSLCLDWREVCDDHTDCLDGGADEAHCFELELNQCEDYEYRCHNGLCIPIEFLDDQTSQCLDTSDVFEQPVVVHAISEILKLDYEEHTCRQGDAPFTCGYGNCVPYFESCKTKRHLHLIESVTQQGNLSYDCWFIMVCLTRILNRVGQVPCRQVLNSSTINNYVKSCDAVIQFPIIPIAFGHVRFLYFRDSIHDINASSLLKPDYICYDRLLCDFLIPTYRYRNYTCRHSHEINLESSMNAIENWVALVRFVQSYFRRCSSQLSLQNYNSSSALYCCKNSSKCISKSRILDGKSDCYLNDDEYAFNISCSIKNALRLDCTDQNRCYSPLIQQEVCPRSRYRRFDEIKFEHICDRVVHLSPMMIDGRNYTDETECELWPCKNHYTRCNNFWNCLNGEDEENCGRNICTSQFFPCVSPHNRTLTCLPAEQVGNGQNDCYGALDERDYCFRMLSGPTMNIGFRCLNSTQCLSSGDLCNHFYDCPLKDDEVFCTYHRKVYDPIFFEERNDVEEVLRLADSLRIPFSFDIVASYPIVEEKYMSQIRQSSCVWRDRAIDFITDKSDDPAWAWRCNHGVYVRQWLGNTDFNYRCLCPSNYYGDNCQYQNQRVSLSLRIRAINPNSMVATVVSLIEEDNERQEINSYEQFISTTFRHCEENFNAFLVYRSRPKILSKNYSIRIDAYDKITLTYISSWHFNIPFPFLPVNRMAVVVTVPSSPVSPMRSCSLQCENGHCMQYLNKDEYFCRCNSGWSGARCHIKVRCSDCSNDSLCVGMIHNRSICVCPPNKWGSRCYLNFTCPEEICENGGRCFVTMDRKNDLGYVCMCPMEFTGVLCQFQKYKLEISFDNSRLSSFLLLYVFDSVATQYYLDYIILKVIPYKITMFQRTLSVYSTNALRLVFAKLDNEYYLIVSQRFDLLNISTSIDGKQRCQHVGQLLKTEIAKLPEIRRIKHYHAICRTYKQIPCFFDEFYMCLCSNESHAHCFNFKHSPPKCQHNLFCQNGAECWQDDVKCPKTTVCVCANCFFGDQCQFYGKGIGLTLDDIFHYEIQPNITISKQNGLIKWSVASTTVIFIAGWINSGLSLITFRTKRSRDIGSGIYLLTLSITSFLTTNILAVKFWFLILTQLDLSVSRATFLRCCISFEFILKTCSCLNNWLNASVAVERMMFVRNASQNKDSSKRIARRVIAIVPFLVAITLIHEPLYRDIFNDKEEQRLRCAFPYSPSIHKYNTFILLFHFIGPLLTNIASALFVIFGGIRWRTKLQRRQTYNRYLRQQLREHKSFIISPITLVILSLPSLLISLLSGCMKGSDRSWRHLLGYILSFLPSISIFITFVLPSPFYMTEFKRSLRSCCR